MSARDAGQRCGGFSTSVASIRDTELDVKELVYLGLSESPLEQPLPPHLILAIAAVFELSDLPVSPLDVFSKRGENLILSGTRWLAERLIAPALSLFDPFLE